nr:hypothetical protein [Tanacetum cinerariifolium]
MPFGLKNAGATYQRLMDKAFESQVGRNIEVYVDDLVVKSHTEAEMVRDIEETFRTLRKINMKLNPKKCSFGLAEGLFLGYVITPEGIKPCSDKTAAVLQLPSPQTVKEVQSLNGKLASLNSPDDGKRNNSNADLLHKPGVTGSGAKLFANGEIGFVTSLCSKEAPIVFSGSPYHGHYGPTNQAGDVPQAAPTAAAQEEPWTLFTDGSSCVDGQSSAGNVCGKGRQYDKVPENSLGLVNGFTTFSISQVPRSKNKQANALSKIASTSFAHPSKQILVEVLENKSIKENEVAAVIEEDGPTWMTQIADYLKEGVLPGDNKEARKLRLKAWSCSMHARPRSVVAKAIRLGYYWPTMHKDARDMIRKCNDCQIHRPVTRHPQQPLTPITAPWPFYKWGIDIAGPFLEGLGKVKFLIVAMDYLTKWVEAKAVATITGRQVKKFVWDNIVCRFAVRISQAPAIQRTGEKGKPKPGEGIKVRLGEEIGMPTYRTAAVNVVNNDKELRLNIDLLKECRERAAICEARAKSKMMNHAVAGGKLGPKWEGPYEVTEALGNGAYKLRYPSLHQWSRVCPTRHGHQSGVERSEASVGKAVSEVQKSWHQENGMEVGKDESCPGARLGYVLVAPHIWSCVPASHGATPPLRFSSHMGCKHGMDLTQGNALIAPFNGWNRTKINGPLRMVRLRAIRNHLFSFFPFVDY